MNARVLVRCAVAGAGLSLLAACGGATAANTSQAPAATVQPVTAAHGPNLEVTMTIATPDMLKTDTGPAFIPSRLTLPADTDVTVTIVNFDNATPLTGAATKFAAATGIIGSLVIEPIDTANPNGPASGTGQGVMAIDPTTVSHTFTVPALGLNVPVASQSRTTFSFHTGAAGTYEWRCMDPCGTGDTGWGGAMTMAGYMTGTLRIV